MIDKVTGLVVHITHRILGRKFWKHYVAPLRRGFRSAKSYDPRAYFTSHYRLADGCPSDAFTINPDNDLRYTRFHYNTVENRIIQLLVRESIDQPRVLDIGSGAGHWIDFYLDVFDAVRIVGCDIAPPAVAALQEKYAGNDSISVLQADVSKASWSCEEKFDVVNAIGVMFHIVDDTLWENTLANLASHLVKAGLMVVGGQFGWITQNVQFLARDTFQSTEERAKAADDAAQRLVNKRIRSKKRWKRHARSHGLELVRVARGRCPPCINVPENHIALFRRV